MAVMAKWNDHKFEVSPAAIRSFTGLSFKGSSETEEKNSSGQKYVARKNGNPLEISLTAVLDSRLGCDVRKEAAAWIEEARAGKTGYFYVHEKKNYYKLAACKMMLTEASATEIELTPSGQWLKANVQLTLKQCGNSSGGSGGGTGGSSGSGSGSGGTSGYSKKSVKSTSALTSFGHVPVAAPEAARSIDGAWRESIESSVSEANKSIEDLRSRVKKDTVAQKRAVSTAKKATSGTVNMAM